MAMSGSIFDVVMGDIDENYSEVICAICDNGGELICCEGKCLRSFHATVEDGIDSACDSLELSDKIIKEGAFICENCQYNQHQCYVCGKLGSSDKSAGAEVFQCGASTCGYFYHPSCVANALRFIYENESKDVIAEIASGKPFSCPLHFCNGCKQKEQKNETSILMQFAMCRRCPIAFHRKCLPGTITFEDDDDEGIMTRAWDDLIPNKILIYCMEHLMDEDLQTPLRDHLNFPYSNMEKEKQVKEPISQNLSKRTLSKASDCFKSEKLQEEGQLERSNYLRKQKMHFASKTKLQKSSSSSESYKNCSGLYSFRDRKLVTKYRMVPLLAGLKKKVGKLENDSSSEKNMDALLSNTGSSGSEKQREISREVEGSGISCSEKGSVSVEKESSCSEKKRKISEKIAAACEHGHRKKSKIIKEVAAEASGEEKTSNNDFEVNGLENRESSCSKMKKKSSESRHSFGSSKKQNKIIKEVAAEKQSQRVENLASSKDSMARKLENHVSSGSEKTSRSSKKVEASGISGSEKKRERFKDAATCNNDSVVRKLENQETSCSEKRKGIENRHSSGSFKKQNKIIKEVPPVSGASNLKNREACGSEKRSESVEKLAGIKDSMARKLENHVSSGSQKTSRSSKEVVEASGISGSEKQREKFEKVASFNNDSVVSKLKNQESSGSEKRKSSENGHSFGSLKKRSKIIKEVEAASGSEKRSENVKKIATGSKDSTARKLENHVSTGSEKTSRNNKDSGISVREKERERFKEVASVYNDYLVSKLKNQESSVAEKRKSSENGHSFGSHKKRSKIIKEVAAASGWEKGSEAVKKVVAAGSKDSMASKLENHVSFGSEKRKNNENQHSFGSLKIQSKVIKDVAAAVCSANKLENQEACGSEKLKDYRNKRLENNVSCGSKKTSGSSKKEVVETCRISGSEKPREKCKVVAAAACNKDYVVSDSGSEKKRKSSENRHSSKDVAAVSNGTSKLEEEEKCEEIKKVESKEHCNGGFEKEKKSSKNNSCGSNSMNSSSSGMDEPKSLSKTTFKSLSFFCGPYQPPSEYNSAGWLTE